MNPKWAKSDLKTALKRTKNEPKITLKQPNSRLKRTLVCIHLRNYIPFLLTTILSDTGGVYSHSLLVPDFIFRI
jgi:hypothetical protein